jgi:hypothetical protein
MGPARASGGRLRRSCRSVSTWRKGSPLSSRGRACPGRCSGRADGWWDVVPQSTATRAPQVLLWLTKQTSTRGGRGVVRWGWTGASAATTCACWSRTAACWPPGGSPTGWPGRESCTRWSPPTPRTQRRWRSGSRPTGACWSGRCWRPATRSTRSTRRWLAATAAATGSRGPSPTAATPRSWPTWSAPTGTTTARSPATARWPRRSRCWPAPTRAWSGRGSGTSTRCAARCGSSTRARFQRSAPSWPRRRPWRSWRWRRRRSRAGG